MTARRAAAVLAAGLAVSGCQVHTLADRLERIRALPDYATLPEYAIKKEPETARLPAAKRPGSPRMARRATGTPLSAPSASTGSEKFVLEPQTPYVGSPEWSREQRQTERREKALDRLIRGICNC